MSPQQTDDLALQALDWLLGRARERDGGLWWPYVPGDDELDPTLYSGAAGNVLALLEGQRRYGDGYGDAAIRAARLLAVDWPDSSPHMGVTGMAFALWAVGDRLGDAEAAKQARRSLELVRSRFDGERWSDQFELLGGNAGIALGALSCGDTELAELAVTPCVRTAAPTPGGVQWEVRAGMPARFHHISHGTLGIVVAMASVGRALERRDLVDLAVAGASDVVARNEAGPDGFLVPHSDPRHQPDLIERYSYGWCHGPAGDAQAFRVLGSVTGDPVWTELVDRCWRTVKRSGVPLRLRPGFWDDSGRCCGTAGVLALACDLGDVEFARVLVADIAARATVDADGARWSNVEHRRTPSSLEPRIGWAMGNAGIARELLRFAGLAEGRDPGYAVPLPDHLP